MVTLNQDPRLEELETVNEVILSSAVRHAVFLERLKSSEVRKIIGLVNDKVVPDLINQLQRRLRNIKQRGFDTGPATTRRIREMIGALDKTVETGVSLIQGQVTGSMDDLAKAEARWLQTTINRAVKGPIKVDFLLPGQSTLKQIVSKRPVLGQVFKDQFKNLSAATKQTIQEEVGIGLVEGQTVPQIVRRVEGAGGAVSKFRRQTEAVVRTAINHSSAQAREITYEENEDVIKFVQYVSTLDARTTDICMSLDGRTFKVGEGPRPPQHFNCRSTTIPVIKSAEELRLKGLPVGTRESLNGAVPADLTYNDWLKIQDSKSSTRGLVEEALGKKRAELWRAGKIKSVRDLVDQNHRPLTLTQIARREGFSLN